MTPEQLRIIAKAMDSTPCKPDDTARLAVHILALRLSAFMTERAAAKARAMFLARAEDLPPPLCFEYTNAQGKKTSRRVEPVSLEFSFTPDFPEAQWQLRARDIDRETMRTFALANIRALTPELPS